MRAKLLTLFLALLLLLSACSGKEDPPAEETLPAVSPTPVAEVTAEPSPTP